MIDVMTRLKAHHLKEAGLPHAAIGEKCGVSLRSIERVVSEPKPPLGEAFDDQLEGRVRPGRPSKANDEIRALVLALLEAEPRILATEVLRRSRE